MTELRREGDAPQPDAESTVNQKTDAQVAEVKTQAVEPKTRSNLFVRVAASVVLLPILLLLVVYSTPIVWGIFIGLAAFVGSLEYMRITNGSESVSTRVISAGMAIVPAATVYVFMGDNALVDVAHPMFIFGTASVITLWGAFLFNCLRPRDIGKAGNVINSTLSAAAYVGILFLFLALMKRDLDDQAVPWLFTLMAMTWLSDTGAYFVGRNFGKHKLAPILSPKKTVEGAVGGFVSAILAAVLAHYIAFPEIDLGYMLLLGAVANVLAQMGDLSESLLKRSYGVKDSGKIIPGHGGILDRVDALIFSAPWVYAFALYFSFY